MSYLLAAAGFMALIVLHELGHFFAAKAVGMRVERFSLFFPPFAYRKQGKGETEYCIGLIPLGGYVKISGMNPHEELPPEVEHRAYYRQKPWKRIVVILAGPAVNIVLAFAILAALYGFQGVPALGVAEVQQGQPAAGILEKGDRIVAVDGRDAEDRSVSEQISSHRCAGTPKNGCRATTPALMTLERDGRIIEREVTPVYDAEAGRTRVGFLIDTQNTFRDVGPVGASDAAVTMMANVVERTFTVLSRLYKAEQRRELSGVVGSYEATRQAVNLNFETTMLILALISLSLGVINLFPFLPLDGGHVFWAVAEKVRGKAIPFSVMERAGMIGFALVGVLFVIGLTNDINRLFGEGFGPPR